MAAVVDEATRTRFVQLLRSPSLEGMVALPWEDFEDFVRFVFEGAGYHVTKVASQHHRHHVDLELRYKAEGRVVALVEVRRYTTANIIKARVLQFVGALNAKHVPAGFLVTTTDFTQPGYGVAQEVGPKLLLVNGQHFLRFIKYVHGSRLTGDAAEKLAVPQPLISPSHLFEADSIPRHHPLTTTVLAIANNKGGVAKTTTALNLAFALADKRRQRVLLVDMEGQSSLTKAFLGAAEEVEDSLLDHFTRSRPLVELVHDTPFSGIWLVPADERLFLYEPRAERRPETELAFVRALHSPLLLTPDGQPFDWVIIDTPPTQYFLTRLAMAASHYVLVPATAETQAVYGANIALATAATMQALMGDGVKVMGGVVTRWRKSVPAEQALVGLVDILHHNGTQLLASRIREDLHIEKAHQKVYGGKLTDLFHLGHHQSPAADDYEDLMKEVLKHVHGN